MPPLTFALGRIDETTYELRLEERKKYRARPKGSPDGEGHWRLQCPAAGIGPTARCPLKPDSQRTRKMVKVTIRPTADVSANPPTCCTQQSITMAPERGAKFHQELPYGTQEWHDHFSTLRNAIEGMNGYVKDGAHEALGEPLRRRMRGRAAQSVLVAFLLFAANLRKIVAFLQQEAAIEKGNVRRLPRRRTTRSLDEFRPPSRTPEAPDRSPPD